MFSKSPGSRMTNSSKQYPKLDDFNARKDENSQTRYKSVKKTRETFRFNQSSQIQSH
jgi:hypothetical protein